MRRKYVASGKADDGALLVLFAATLVAAVGIGAIEGFISQWFNLVLLFPLLLGALVGLAGVWVVKVKKVRKPMFVIAVGFAMGFLSQGVVHFVEYRVARSTIADNMKNDAQAAAFVRANGEELAVDLALGGKDGDLPIVGYVKLAAEQGITISNAGSSYHESSPTFSGVGVYIYWLVEFLVAGGMAAFILWTQAREPFCEKCDAWYTLDRVVASGAGGRASIKATIERIESGRFAEAVRALGKTDGNTMSVLALRSCAQCRDGDLVFELRHITGMNRRQQAQTRRAYTTIVSESEAQELVSATSVG